LTNSFKQNQKLETAAIPSATIVTINNGCAGTSILCRQAGFVWLNEFFELDVSPFF